MTSAPSSGPRGPPPGTTAAAAGSTGCCAHCGVPGVLPDWLERLHVAVCSACSRRHERFISKSNAKALYLLSDGDLAPLGYLEKANPHHAKFALMRQYLVSQVEAVAVSKHGSLGALEEEKQRRMRGKLDKRLTKRKAAEDAAARQEQHEAALAAAVERFTSSHEEGARGGAAAAAAEPEDVVDARTGKRLRRFGEGLAAAEVEEF